MIAAIFAVDQTGGMGINGHLPWPHNKDDMMWFKSTTQNHIVVMGRKTWDSPDMPKPLPGRTNVLFTNHFIDNDDIEQIRGNVSDALLSIKRNNKKFNIFVIGGPTLLMQARPVLEKAFITRIPGEYQHDTRINLEEFLEGFTLEKTVNLGTCVIEEYKNETILKSVRTRSRKRKDQE